MTVCAAAMVLVKPPLWLRGGVASSLPNGGGFVRTEAGRVFDPDWIALPLAVAGLAVIGAVLGWCALAGHRRGDDVVVAGVLVGAVALLAAIVSLAGLPVDAFGFSAHKARWLWSLGAFLTAVVAVSWLRLAALADRRQAVFAIAPFGAIALAATLPTTYQLLSPQQYLTDSYDAAHALRAAAGRLDDRGTIFLDTSGRPFPDPYDDTLAAELVRRGIPVRVAGDYLSGQYGEFRRLDDGEATTRVRVVVGPDALAPPSGAQRLLLTFAGPQPMALLLVDADDALSRGGSSG